jgi:gliding motility-associated-like protein
LIATDGNGCKDTLISEIRVSLPIAGIHYELDGASINENGDYNCPPVFATFVDGTEDMGNITSWQWDFGDGKQSTLENPGNTYVFAGTYTATLAVTDQFGCTSDTALIEYLTIFGPSADAVWTATPDFCGQEILFELQNPVNVTEVIWSTGDGHVTNDSISFVYTYGDVDTYTPSVTIKDMLGCEVIYPLPDITIPDIGLDAFFVANPTTADIGSNVLFIDQSASDDEIINWQWDFGNGNSLINNTGETVSNAYYIAGNQVITLTITDENGCKDMFKVTIQIIGNFEMPNVLTPNGDGSNDVFTIYADIFKSYDILILNRWGNVIQENLGQTGSLLWDGKNMQGEQCADGVYFYQLNGTLKDGTPLSKNGFVTLIASK